MRLHSKLSHIEEGIVIVTVTAYIDDREVCNAMGQGISAEIAEDSAINRLNKRLNLNVDVTSSNRVEISNNKINQNTHFKDDLQQPLSSSRLIDDISNDNPQDWSQELTEIDSELKRLQWSRENESSFLKLNYGITDRNRITDYTKLMDLLSKLKSLPNNNENYSKENLINIIEKKMNQLSWTHEQGRKYINTKYNILTRFDLSIDQLNQFIDHLDQEIKKKH